MIAATFTKARKLAAFFSYRVATRRYCFTFDQNRSHRFWASPEVVECELRV